MSTIQTAKSLVLQLYGELDGADASQVGSILARHTSSDYRFRGVHPFNELAGAERVAEMVWLPLWRALRHRQRRQDIFIAGINEIDGEPWVCSMGHLMGLLDAPWLGIPDTGRLALLRYAEFSRIAAGRIAETGFFCDLIGFMRQAGIQCLPPSTGAEILVPGPRTHDGLLFESQPESEAQCTLALVNRMKDDLTNAASFASPNAELARTWHPGMLWFGPSGIGSTYTFDRYQAQHQGPFSRGLQQVTFNGHVCRFAEGRYAAWFGWPNLTMTPIGGFLGLPACEKRVDMRVVDIYRREDEKLAENWILIDLPYFLLQQNLDVLDRMRYLATAR